MKREPESIKIEQMQAENKGTKRGDEQDKCCRKFFPARPANGCLTFLFSDRSPEGIVHNHRLGRIKIISNLKKEKR
jgi:hypothetical protein